MSSGFIVLASSLETTTMSYCFTGPYSSDARNRFNKTLASDKVLLNIGALMIGGAKTNQVFLQPDFLG